MIVDAFRWNLVTVSWIKFSLIILLKQKWLFTNGFSKRLDRFSFTIFMININLSLNFIHNKQPKAFSVHHHSSMLVIYFIKSYNLCYWWKYNLVLNLKKDRQPSLFKRIWEGIGLFADYISLSVFPPNSKTMTSQQWDWSVAMLILDTINMMQE